MQGLGPGMGSSYSFRVHPFFPRRNLEGPEEVLPGPDGPEAAAGLERDPQQPKRERDLIK